MNHAVIFSLMLASGLLGSKPVAKTAPHTAEVKLALNQAVAAKSQDEQQAAFDRILALGCTAVPAIAAQLEDRRRLPVRYIRLENRSAQRFEAFRQYGPEIVGEAVAAILSHLTGQHFGSIYNGARPAEREEAYRQWHAFVQSTPPEKLCGD